MSSSRFNRKISQALRRCRTIFTPRNLYKVGKRLVCVFLHLLLLTGGPPGAHVYFFSQIIHNYPDHVCQDILARAAKAMSLKSRLLIVESVLPATTDVGGDMGAYLVDVS